MSRNIIHRAAGIAMTAVMALSGCMGQICGIALAAEDTAVIGDPAMEMAETAASYEDESYYYVTLPQTEHLEYRPQKDHIYVPDPDERTDDEKKDILLIYREGDEVEIGFDVPDSIRVSNARLLDKEKEETGFEWKNETTICFRMPAEDLKLEVVLEEAVFIEEQLAPDPGISGEEMANAPPLEDPSGSGQPADTSMPDTSADASVTGDPVAADSDMGSSITYVPDKDPDGLPVQGSIEQTETLEVILNDAGFDPRIDFRNVPYDPTIYRVEYISDDIDLASLGTYSCIYKVTSPGSGKFFFVLRPVKVVEKISPPAPLEEVTSEDGLSEREVRETENPAMDQEAVTQTEEAAETEEDSLAAAGEEAAETEIEEAEGTGTDEVALAEGEELGVELSRPDGV